MQRYYIDAGKEWGLGGGEGTLIEGGSDIDHTTTTSRSATLRKITKEWDKRV